MSNVAETDSADDARRPTPFLTYALAGVGLGSNAMVYLLVPLRAAELGISVGWIGALLAVKSLVEAGISVPTGGLIERVGPKSVYLFGCAGIVAAGIGFTLVASLPGLVLIQASLGATRPMAWVGGQAYVSTASVKTNQAVDMGRFSFAANVGQIVAPMLAGLAVQIVGERAAFLALAAYGVLFFCVGVAVPRLAGAPPNDTPSRGGTYRRCLGLLCLRGMRVVVLLTFARLWLPTAWSAFLPLFLVQAGTSASVAGTASAVMAATATVVSLLAGRVTMRGRSALMTAAALGISSIGVALTPLTISVPAVYLPAVMVGIGQGLSLPLLLVLVGETVPTSQRHLALGMRSGANQAAAMSAPLVIGGILTVGGVGMGFGVVGVVGGLLVLFAAATNSGQLFPFTRP